MKLPRLMMIAKDTGCTKLACSDPGDADYVRIDIARKMQASGKEWRERAHKAIMQRDGARKALAKLVERTDGWTIRAERLEDAIRTALAVLEETPSDTPTRERAVAALRAAVEEG